MESQLEQLILWESELELEGAEAEALQILSNDSERHRLIVEYWMEIANITIPKELPSGVPVKHFDFGGMDGPEMFQTIRKYEILAHSDYKKIASINQNDLQEYFGSKEKNNEFTKQMEKIAEEEERHR
ncbi:MAG: hypothetical protein ACOCPU_05800 [Methanohalophilus sp.]